MTDNTKLKSRLRYSPTLGCIVGSVFSNKETKINVYADIPNIISKIKNEKGIAKDVRVYILQVIFNILFYYYFSDLYLNILICIKLFVYLILDSFTKIPTYCNCIDTK